MERTDDGLLIEYTVGGNCGVLYNMSTFLRELEEVLDEGNITPRALKIEVDWVEGKK